MAQVSALGILHEISLIARAQIPALELINLTSLSLSSLAYGRKIKVPTS